MRTFKYKLQNHKRNRYLHRDLNIESHVHNHFIALLKRHYRIYGKCEGYKTPSMTRLSRHLTKLKRLEKFTHWRVPYSWAVQNVLTRILRGYDNFFAKRAKRPPRFKRRVGYASQTFDGKQCPIEGVVNKEYGIRRSAVARIRLNGRWYKFWYSRPIEGNIKQVTVKRDKLGDFYLTITTDDAGLTPEPKTGIAAGFDFGLTTYLTCSDGTKYESPEFYKQASKQVKKASCNLSRKQRGSKNRHKARLHLARAHRKIERQREDHHWKLALDLVRQFDICFFEDLNLKGMMRLWGRKVSDLAFGNFMQKIRWQADKRCKRVEIIDRWTATTPLCHVCGQKQAFIDLKVREWRCGCGLTHDRDLNAAINILKVGTSTFEVGDVRLAIASGLCR